MEIQVEFLGYDVDLKLVLIWFMFSHVGFRTGYQLFILKVLLICIYTFWTVYTFCKITTCIPLYFSIAKGLAMCRLGGVIRAEKCYFEPYSRWVLGAFCALIISIKPIDVCRST